MSPVVSCFPLFTTQKAGPRLKKRLPSATNSQNRNQRLRERETKEAPSPNHPSHNRSTETRLKIDRKRTKTMASSATTASRAFRPTIPSKACGMCGRRKAKRALPAPRSRPPCRRLPSEFRPPGLHRPIANLRTINCHIGGLDGRRYSRMLFGRHDIMLDTQGVCQKEL